MTEKKITVGIIQQQNTGDIADNKKRLKQHIEQCAAKGARLVVLQELHNSLYFCQIESTDNFDLAESIPGESTEFYSRIAGELHIVLVTFSNDAQPDYTTTQQSCSTPMVLSPESIVKCTYRTTRPITKNSISPPAIWDSPP